METDVVVYKLLQSTSSSRMSNIMDMAKFGPRFKLLLIGDSDVGKADIVTRFCYGETSYSTWMVGRLGCIAYA